MKLSAHCFLLVAFLMSAITVRSEDLHCMDRAWRFIPVEDSDYNPKRVMTYVRDEPSYGKTLTCVWTLWPQINHVPSQMYIQVPVVDFDTNVPETQCNSSIISSVDSPYFLHKRKQRSVDIFHFIVKHNQTSFRNESWCSDGAVKVRTEILNFWDESYNLTAVFLSDGKQVRNNSKGIQMDVWVLGRDYCHAQMLYLDGKCYLITPENVTLTEAFKLAKNYLGNVFTSPTNETMAGFLSRFFRENVGRRHSFPYDSPLNLVGVKMWTGYFSVAGYFSRSWALFLDPSKECNASAQRLDYAQKANSSEAHCGIAIEWQLDGKPLLTCEPIHRRLPALIQFNQIPANANDTTPWMFSTCSELPAIVKSTV